MYIRQLATGKMNGVNDDAHELLLIGGGGGRLNKQVLQEHFNNVLEYTVDNLHGVVSGHSKSKSYYWLLNVSVYHASSSPYVVWP